MLSCVTRKASAKTSKAAPLSSLDSRAEILASNSLNEFTAYRPWATNSAVRGCLGTSGFMMECKCIFLYTVQLVFGVCLLNFRALLLEHRRSGPVPRRPHRTNLDRRRGNSSKPCEACGRPVYNSRGGR